MSETGIDKKLAKSLMDIHAILLRPDQPFTWASGWHSPIYCDNRRILSHPELRSQVAGWLAEKAMELYPEAEVVAGVATGAIAHGVLAADRMAKPFVYVRPKPKDHGTHHPLGLQRTCGNRKRNRIYLFRSQRHSS